MLRKLGLAIALLLLSYVEGSAQAIVRPCVTLGVNNCPPVSASNPLPVTATVSATVGGFAPGGAYATLTATGSSATTALPAGIVVVAYNTGTTAVSCTLGVTAVANEDQIAPGGFFSYTVGANTNIACIDQTGTVSNLVVLSGGTGLATGSGGGGGGGGGSSAITTWAGGTLGAMANYGTSPGAVLVPGVNAFITNTPTVTANAGTNLNTSTLATSANQTNASQKSQVVDGAGNVIASTSNALNVDVTNANVNGQATMANSSPVVVASNQSNIPVNVAAFGGTATTTGQVAVNTAPVTATNTALVVDLRPDSPGIIALGPAAAANAVPVVGSAPSSSALIGITPVVGGSAISSLVLKASAGNLYSVYAECSAACWLMVFNSTSAPSNGATTAGVASGNMVECIPIASGGSGSISYQPGPPAVYSVGITAAISSTTCATLTLATTGFIHGMVM